MTSGGTGRGGARPGAGRPPGSTIAAAAAPMVKRHGRGGAREGAGRPPGSRATATLSTIEQFRENYPILPLNHMLEVLNGRDPLAGRAR